MKKYVRKADRRKVGQRKEMDKKEVWAEKVKQIK